MTLSPRHLLPIALLAAATLAAWFAAPSPVRPEAGTTAKEDWEMPKIQPREPAKWIDLIDRHMLWGGGKGGAVADASHPGASEKANWSIVGVAIQGGDIFALISTDDKPSQQYRVGDSTPDGAKILKIEEDRLHLLANGKESILEIYRK